MSDRPNSHKEFLDFLKDQLQQHTDVNKRLEKVDEKLVMLITKIDKRIDRLEKGVIAFVVYLVASGTVEGLGLAKLVLNAGGG